MKKLILISIFSIICFSLKAQNNSEIEAVLSRQQNFWNAGDIDNFMEDYWKSDELKFIGKSGVVTGWQATKDRYHKNYSDRAKMGTLKFDVLNIDFYTSETAGVLGKWFLARPKEGDIGGYFTLILKKINGKWLIVSDHSS